MSSERKEQDIQQLARREMQLALDANIDEVSWEEYLSIWDALNEHEDNILWAKALVCAAIEVQYGEESIRAFANDVGIGESTAYGYRRTWMEFPRSEDRFPELSFSHHRIAATTNNSHYWIEDAALHGLSTHAMERKIRKRQQQTKAALVEEQKKALTSGEEVPEPEEIEVPANHNVPLSPTPPATFSAKEQEAARKELEESCTQWFFDRIEDQYLVSDIIKAMKTVIASARAGE